MNIVVCTLPRSGSNWFRDELLRRGYPECSEWLHPTNPMYYKQFQPKCEQLRTEGKDFGIKVFPNHVQKAGGLDKICQNIKNPPNVFIRLRRQDTDAQAVSLANAMEASSPKIWFGSTQQGDASPKQVADKLKTTNKWNDYWDNILSRKEHLLIYYEEMVVDVEGVMNSVVEYLESKR